MTAREAIIDTMNYAFPTIVTSGTMLATAGILIGQMTSEPCIAGIGVCLGRGTIISIFIVMFALPQILLFGDRLIEHTSFDMNVKLPGEINRNTGLTRVDGFVRGHINGDIIGFVRGTVIGEVDIRVNNLGDDQSKEEKAGYTETLLEDKSSKATKVDEEEGGDSDEE